jgi:hypothetical protein
MSPGDPVIYTKRRPPVPDMRLRYLSVMAKVLAHVEIVPSGCWEWQLSRNHLEYPVVGFDGGRWMVTRLISSAIHGSFDPLLDACHSCDNPPCCNPDHLWLGTPSENFRDSILKGRNYWLSRSECERGHPLSKSNRGWRICKVCKRASYRIAAGWPEELAYSVPPQPGKGLRYVDSVDIAVPDLPDDSGASPSTSTAECK